jgi:hypothetical protein
VGGEDFDPLAHGKEYRDSGREPFDPHVASDKTGGVRSCHGSSSQPAHL